MVVARYIALLCVTKLSKSLIPAEDIIVSKYNDADALPAEFTNGWRARAVDWGKAQPIPNHKERRVLLRLVVLEY
jgi:hypothetical protein